MVEVNWFSIKINVDNWWHWFPNVPIKHFFLFCDYSHAFPHFSNQCKLFWSKMITSIAVTILHAIGESAGNICLVYNFEVCMNMNTVVTCKQLFNYLFILPGSSVHIPGNMNNCTCWLQMKFDISRIMYISVSDQCYFCESIWFAICIFYTLDFFCFKLDPMSLDES